MRPSAKLHELQTLDSQLDTIDKRVSEIEAILSENEAVKTAQVSLASAEAELAKWQKSQKEHELERSALKREADAIQSRLYSGNVHNPRELTDLQEKSAELKRRHEEMEEPLLEAMFAVEECITTIAQRRVTLEQIQEQVAAKFGEVSVEQADLLEKRTGLQAQSDALRNTIDPAYITLYNELRKKPSGVAVASIEGDSCGVCLSQIIVKVVQQARHGEIVTCPTCKRILHHP